MSAASPRFTCCTSVKNQTVAEYKESSMIDYCVNPCNPDVRQLWMAFWRGRLVHQINACSVVWNSSEAPVGAFLCRCCAQGKETPWQSGGMIEDERVCVFWWGLGLPVCLILQTPHTHTMTHCTVLATRFSPAEPLKELLRQQGVSSSSLVLLVMLFSLPRYESEVSGWQTRRELAH